MNREDIIRMAREAGLHIATDVNWMPIIGLEYAEKFAALVASAEREKLEGQIQTLSAMYELASKQRDYLMDQQRAQVEAMRGRIQ
jgi:hypothetical protein